MHSREWFPHRSHGCPPLHFVCDRAGPGQGVSLCGLIRAAQLMVGSPLRRHSPGTLFDRTQVSRLDVDAISSPCSNIRVTDLQRIGRSLPACDGGWRSPGGDRAAGNVGESGQHAQMISFCHVHSLCSARLTLACRRRTSLMDARAAKLSARWSALSHPSQAVLTSVRTVCHTAGSPDRSQYQLVVLVQLRSGRQIVSLRLSTRSSGRRRGISRGVLPQRQWGTRISPAHPSPYSTLDTQPT